MPIELSTYNDNIKSWGARFRATVINKGNALGITHRTNSPSPAASLPKIRDKYRVRYGAINKVVFTFPRSLIYTQQGAGKGIGGIKGSRWVNAKGETKKTNVKSLGKIGSSKRTQKDFINQALDSPQGLTELSDIAAESLGDAIVTGIKIS